MAEERVYEFGRFRLRTSDGSLFHGGELVALPPKALQVLQVLVQHHGQVVSHEQLVNAVWPDTVVEEGNLKVYISMLRKTLAGGGLSREAVQTVPRRGYRFVAEMASAAPEMPRTAAPAARLTRKQTGAVIAIACGLMAAGFALSRGTLGDQPGVLAVRQLTAEGIVCADCPLVADAQRVYFTRSRGNRTEIAWIPVNGGTVTPIAAPFPNPTVLGLAPDRRELLVSSIGRVEDPRTFWIVPSDGGEARQLGIRGLDAAWTPDGNHIAYTNENELRFVSRAGASEGEPLKADGIVCDPGWSPDGALVTYTVRAGYSTSLWQAERRGGTPQPVRVLARQAQGAEYARGGGWSPDGRYFFFFGFRRSPSGEGTTTIWARRQAGLPPPVRLHDIPAEVGGMLTAGVDGKHVFFNARRQTFEEARYDSRTGGLLPLPLPVVARRSEFSPDGQWLAYVPESDLGLWRCRRDGSERVPLVQGSVGVFHARWAPDGRSIAAQVVKTGAPGYIAIMRQGLPDVEPVPLGYLGDGPNWSNDGRRLLIRGCQIQPQASDCRHRLLMVDLETKKNEPFPDSDGLGGQSWSPDERYIAAHTGNHAEIRLFDMARRQWTVVRAGGFFGTTFWSGDSQSLFFQDLSERPSQPILRYRPSTGSVERVTPASIVLPAGVSAFRLAGVTPEGEPRVAMVRDHSEIYVLDVVLP